MSALRRLVLLSLVPLVLAACSTTRTGSPQAGTGGYASSGSLSTVLAKPLSWDKLDELEAWLDVRGSRASAHDRNEARLALGEGLSAYARRDVGTQSAAVLDIRSQRATADFREVLTDGGASSAQRARARNGIALLESGSTATASARVPRTTAGGTTDLITRGQWGASPEVPRYMSRHRAPWSKITIHHTAMPLGGSTTLAARAGELRTIQRGHLNKPEGWGDIGYHFLIDPEGRVYEGRRLTWRGAHVGGQNDHNLGVCLLGNFETTRPTSAALASLERLVDELRAEHRIPRSAVTYHKEWPTANTACPGRHLAPWVESYRGGSPGLVFHSHPTPATRRVSGGGGTVR